MKRCKLLAKCGILLVQVGCILDKIFDLDVHWALIEGKQANPIWKVYKMCH